MSLTPLQGLWYATKAVHDETDSYGSDQDTYYVMHFLDLSVAIGPDLATRVHAIPLQNFTVEKAIDYDSLWQRIQGIVGQPLGPAPDWNAIAILGDLGQAVEYAAR